MGSGCRPQLFRNGSGGHALEISSWSGGYVRGKVAEGGGGEGGCRNMLAGARLFLWLTWWFRKPVRAYRMKLRIKRGYLFGHLDHVWH